MSQTEKQATKADKSVAAMLRVKFQQGLALHQQGRFAEAKRTYEEILQKEPHHFDALHMLGVLALQTGRTLVGVELITKATQLNPTVAAAHNNLGSGLIDLQRREEAIVCFNKAIALKPDYAEAHTNLGNVLRDLQRPTEALASYHKAIALKPNFSEAYYGRANALTDLSRFDEALASYDKAIALKPDYAEAYNNRGSVLNTLNRLDEALASYDKAVALKPDFAEAYNNRGATLNGLKRREGAIASYDKAIALRPDFAEAYNHRGVALKSLQRYEEALASYDKAIALKPDYEFLLGELLVTKLSICDWSNFERQSAQLVDKINRSEKASTPFSLFALSNSPALQRKAAEIFTLTEYPASTALPKIAKHRRHDKIRLGYFSADFRAHAVAFLIAELFERHTRSQFEVTAFSFGFGAKDDMTRRLEAAFDRFIDVRSRSDKDVALLARSLEIDIAIDLGGFTANNRAGIFAVRAAPLQVNYLGHPGTMGAEYIDYLIADRTLIPESDKRCYSEKIVYLPNTYQVNDSKRHIADKAFTRMEVGLPQKGFVFCCFNNNYKITPEVFDGWMRILKQVEHSVLWLLEDNITAASNLRREAITRGVPAERLIFAKRVPFSSYLARFRLADLFLDTLPYNAGATASDALWVGLPVLTRIGDTYVGRMAASLLKAIGLPELITSTPQAYETLAIELASNPEKLTAIRRKLALNRLATPLFDIQLFTQHIEAAYSTMYERYQAGLQPDHIYVPQ